MKTHKILAIAGAAILMLGGAAGVSDAAQAGRGHAHSGGRSTSGGSATARSGSAPSRRGDGGSTRRTSEGGSRPVSRLAESGGQDRERHAPPDSPRTGEAVPRGSAPAPAPAPAASAPSTPPSSDTASTTAQPRQQGIDSQGHDRRPPQVERRNGAGAQRVPDSEVIPRYSRPRGDAVATGQAVVRTTPVVPPGHYPIYPYYPSYIYAPGASYWGYPYGYWGALNFGSLFWDPFFWSWNNYGYGAPYSSYGYGGYGSGYGSNYGGAAGGYRQYDRGAVKLKIKPRSAQVFVDGAYAGIVDEFDGAFQSLPVQDGTRHIELRAEGYEPLSVDIRVLAGETTTYRGELTKSK